MRWGAGIVGGFLVGFLLYFLVSLIAVTPQVWVLFLGWLVFGYWFARSKEFAWARTWLSLCIGSFALPVATLIFSGRMVANTVSQAGAAGAQAGAEAAGAAIGSTLGGAIATGAASFLGFFLGIIFAVLAYFTFRGAKEADQKAK